MKVSSSNKDDSLNGSHDGECNSNRNPVRHELHRVYLQQLNSIDSNRTNHCAKTIETTSAKIRLTHITTSADVTSLLRKKFGCAPIDQSRSVGSDFKQVNPPLLDRIHARLEQIRIVRKGKTAFNPKRRVGLSEQCDTLVLVATTLSLPKNYVRFDHENMEDSLRSSESFLKESSTPGSINYVRHLNNYTDKAHSFNLNERNERHPDGGKNELNESNANINYSNLTKSSSSPVLGNNNSYKSSTLTNHSFSKNAISPSLKSSNSSSSHENAQFTQHEQILESGEVSKEPFNIIRTLLPHENPLKVRDEMLARLSNIQQVARYEIGLLPMEKPETHMIRWFFMPRRDISGNTDNRTYVTSNSNSIPPLTTSFKTFLSYIDVDGYVTDDEDGEIVQLKLNRDKNDDTCDVLNELKDEKIKATWKRDLVFSSTCNYTTGNENEDSFINSRTSVDQSCRNDEYLGFPILYWHEINLKSNYTSDYLLKQSQNDENVWKRVYCLLTDDHFWCANRIKSRIASKDSELNVLYRGSHIKVKLVGATIHEPINVGSPRTPFVFEIMAGKGISHVFRASSKSSQMHWIKMISHNIDQSRQNNSLMLLDFVVDKEMIRNRVKLQNSILGNIMESLQDELKDTKLISASVRIKKLLQFGLDILEYKDICHSIHGISLPTTQGHSQNNNIRCAIAVAWNIAQSIWSKSYCFTSIMLKNDCIGQHQMTIMKSLNIYQQERIASTSMDGYCDSSERLPPVNLFDQLFRSLCLYLKKC